ncbi:MAG: MATE family efflux transporter [Thermoplasmata archaeon]|nr:MAG: MATE family efflux transporter [Thermoplasmata archaeon]
MHLSRLIHHFHVKHERHDVEEDTKDEILNDDIWTLFKKLAIPSMIGMFMYSVYLFVDLIFVGQWIGANALAAVSIVFPLVLVNLVIAAFAGMGFGSLLSRRLGAGEEDAAKGILTTSTLFVLACSMIYTVLGTIFVDELVAFMGVTGEIHTLGVSYFKIVILGAFLFNFVATATMLVLAEGRPMVTMMIVTIGSLMNIVLDVVFIWVLGWGVEGAAIATVMSMGIAASATLAYYLSGRSELSFDREGLRTGPQLLREIYPVGSSGAAVNVLALVEQVLIFKSVGIYGTDNDFALIGATLNMLAFAAVPLSGIGQGLQPLVGMNWGAKRFDRVKEGYFKFLLASTVIAGVIWALFMLFPEAVLSLYVDDPELSSAGATMFRIVMGVFILRGFIILPPVLFQAIGKGRTAFLLLMSDSVLLFAPVIIAFPYFLGIDGVWLAMLCADILIIVMGLYHVAKEFKVGGKSK